SGFVAGDNVTANYSRVAGETVLGGPYHITATLGPADVVANYNITNAGAAFTINPRNATWTTSNNSKTYGDNDSNPLTTGSGSGFLAADNVTANYSRASGETVLGGPYHITATLSPAAVLSNYNITNAGADFIINAKNAPWTTQPNSKTYGDNDPNPLTSGSGSGFLAADNVTATYSRDPGETVLGGPYHITATPGPAAVLSNYNITNAGASFTINPRRATVHADDKIKTYGDDNPTLTATVTGTVNGDTLDYTLASTALKFSGVGDYPITVTLGSNPNYTVTPTDGTLHIDPKAASVTADNKTKTYGDDNPTLTATVIGTVNGDTLHYTLATTAANFSSVGDYPITVTLGANPNYSVTPANGTLHIDPKNASVTANNTSKTYGQTVTLAGTEFITAGLVNGDNVTSVTLTSGGAAATATVTAPGPDYSIVPSNAVGSGLGNYIISYGNGTLHINTKSALVTANDRLKTYGQTVNFAGTEFTTSGFVNSDSVTSVTLMSTGAAATATVTAPGPDYAIVPSNAVGTGLGNYTISYNNGTLHINTASLTITATDRTKLFGATYTPDTTPPSVDFNVSGLLNSDTVTSITLACVGYPAGALPTPAGYTITPSAAAGTGLANYTIGYMNGYLAIGYGTCTGSNPGGVILQPINTDGTSVFKRGSTVPVKFT